MRELAEVVKFRARSASPIETVDPPYAAGTYDDIESRRPDLTKIETLIGYHPRRSLDDMVDDCLAEVKERRLVLV